MMSLTAMAGMALAAGAITQPNIIVIFCDDLGRGDLSCYGQKQYRTPNIDRMAREGMRFTDFYVVSPACSPSRASLLTGCYPVRVGVPQVLNPDSPTGLALEEKTLAEPLKEVGYKTAIFGKWHLGVKNLGPLNQGFEKFTGIMYSHDMWPQNPRGKWPPLWLYQDGQPAKEMKTLEDQAELTGTLTKEAVKWITDNKQNPFFLYLAHPMPHVPIAVSPAFSGRTGKGLYADCITELDDSVGQILKTLKKERLDKRTLVVFTSDNGPWNPYGDHAGSTGGLREGKGTGFEGGVRSPGIFWWPGTIPARKVCREPATVMDIFPTAVKAAGAKLPGVKMDGRDITPLLTAQEGAKSPHDRIFFQYPGDLLAVRSGDWKLILPHRHRHQKEAPGKDGFPAGEVMQPIELSLFNLRKDPFEKTNLAAQHPDVVERLMKIVEEGRQDLGDTLTGRKGSGVRPPGKVKVTQEP